MKDLIKHHEYSSYIIINLLLLQFQLTNEIYYKLQYGKLCVAYMYLIFQEKILLNRIEK